MDDTIQSEQVGQYTIKLLPDYDAGQFENPAKDEWDNGIRFVTFERRSTLSDLHSFTTPEDAERDAIEREDYIFPLYKFEHGLVDYSVSSYNDPWDSGRVGFVFVSKDSATDHESAHKIASSVCKTVASWCNGDFVGYVIEDPEGETVDSCWGFYGFDSDYAMKQAREIATDFSKSREQQDSRDIGF